MYVCCTKSDCKKGYVWYVLPNFYLCFVLQPNAVQICFDHRLCCSLKIWRKSPYVQSFIYGSVLNPDCVVSVHLSYNVRAVIFVFCFAVDTIFNKKDFVFHGVIEINTRFILAPIISSN